jgi:hypothetical protein
MKPRFLLDEHVNRAVQRQIRRQYAEIDVLAVGDLNAPPSGTPDPDLLVWAEAHGFLLVTEDRSTMPVHLARHLDAERHSSGVLYIRPGASSRQIIEELHLIWTVATAEEFRDQALFIPL